MGTLGAGSFRVKRLNEKSKSFWEKGQSGAADGGEHPQGIWITEKQQIIRKVLKETETRHALDFRIKRMQPLGFMHV